MKFYNSKFNTLVLSIIFLAALTATSFAQKADVDKSQRLLSLEFQSNLMNREMPYRVIVPVGYNLVDNKEKSYPVIYLLHGLWGHYNDWSNKAKLEKHSFDYKYIIVMPEGDNGWYTDSKSVKNHNYESYIINELIPEIENKFRVKKERKSRAIAGLSMGGYGALKFGIKYPDKFVLAGSFSGAIGAAQIKLEQVKNMKVVHDSIKVAFGETNDEYRKENDLYNLIENKSAEQIKKLPFIYMDCGNQDFLIGDNRKFSTLLFTKKIPHEFRQLPGKHDWKFWDSQVQEFLRLSKKFIK